MDALLSSPPRPSPASHSSSRKTKELSCVSQLSDITSQLLSRYRDVYRRCLALEDGQRCRNPSGNFLKKNRRNLVLQAKRDLATERLPPNVDEFKNVIRMFFCDEHHKTKKFEACFKSIEPHWKGDGSTQEMELLEAIRDICSFDSETPRSSRSSPFFDTPPTGGSRKEEFRSSDHSVTRKLFLNSGRSGRIRDRNDLYKDDEINSLHDKNSQQALTPTSRNTSLQASSGSADSYSPHHSQGREGGREQMFSCSRSSLQQSPTSTVFPSNLDAQRVSVALHETSSSVQDLGPIPFRLLADRNLANQRPSMNEQSHTTPNLMGLSGKSGDGTRLADQPIRAHEIPLRQGSRDDMSLYYTPVSRGLVTTLAPNLATDLNPLKSVSAGVVDDKIHKILKTTIDEEGGIYILSAPKYIKHHVPDRSLLKIGKTSNFDDRIKSLSKACKIFDLSKVGGSSALVGYAKVERLVLSELQNYQCQFKCEGCGKRHDEWFDVTKEQAERSIKRWEKFLGQKPYDEIGVLGGHWSQLLQNRAKPDENEHWNDFESRSKRWDQWLEEGIKGWKLILAAKEKAANTSKQARSSREDLPMGNF